MDLQMQLKDILKNKYNKQNELLLPIYLREPSKHNRYDRHYNRQIDLSHLDKPEEEEPSISLEDFLKCDCTHDKLSRTILTIGACGIGKTTAVHQCALDWAEGRAHQHIDLLFPFDCWELKLLRNEMLSLIQLIGLFYPDLKELDPESLSSKKVWFVFDELEDLHAVPEYLCPCVRDVTQVVPVYTLLPNLVLGNLLPQSHLWITTRYPGAKWIWQDHKLKEMEMRGFNDEQKELHVRNLVGDDDLAYRVLDHICIFNSLHHLCRIPYMCTVMATVLKKHVKRDDYNIRGLTLSEIYISFLKEARSQFLPRLKGDVLFGRKNLKRYFCWIHEEELKAHADMTVNEMSSFVRKFPLVFRQEKSVRGVSVFRYAHISVLEFFVALTTFKEITTSKANALKTVCDNIERTYENGQYDICLRFFFGLMKEERTIKFTDPFFNGVKRKIMNGTGDSNVMLFHCVREFDGLALKNDMISYLNLSSSSYTSPFADMSVLYGMKVSVMVGNVDGKVHKFEMDLSSRSDEKLLQGVAPLHKARQAMLRFSNLSDRSCPALASVLHTRDVVLRDLDLGFNSITDKGVQILVQGLKDKDCRLKFLSLQGCELSASACEYLATALKISPNLQDLNLSCNDIGDEGVQLLAKGLQSRRCQLKTLKLSQCNLTKAGGFHLAAALGKNPTFIKWLDLSINNIGNEAANELFTKFDISRLTKLEMYYCGLTEHCCEKLAEALKREEGKLVELNLSSNMLKNGGARWITEGLFAWSRLEKLNLSRCGITAKGCFYLSKVLSCVSKLFNKEKQKTDWQATELKELNLSRNKFLDKGAINLSSGFLNPYSNLKKLDLSECGLTSECCSDLANQLSSSQCGIIDLILSGNCIEDRGIKRLCVALKNRNCPLKKLHVRNCDLTSDCVPSLIAALKTNTRLKLLFIMGNQVDDSAIDALEMLTENDSFTLEAIY